MEDKLTAEIETNYKVTRYRQNTNTTYLMFILLRCAYII